MPYVSNNGIRIYYEEVKGDGPSLVLQHGLSDSLPGWREYGFVERLKEHYRLIMIDGRGHGRSSKPHHPEAYLLRHRVTDVLAVVEALGINRFNFYGNSMGGSIGFGLAQHVPERLISLTIGGSHPYHSDLTFFRQIFAEGLMAWLNLIEKMAGPLPFSTRERFLSNDIDALRASIADDIPDMSAILPGLTIPFKIFAGEADPVHPLALRSAGELPRAEFFTLQRLNHFQAYIRGDLVAPIILDELIPFLEKVNAVTV